MAHKKLRLVAQRSRLASKRLGVKKFGGEARHPGQHQSFVQRGTTWHPGTNVGIGTDHTLFALEAGAVTFNKKATAEPTYR